MVETAARYRREAARLRLVARGIANETIRKQLLSIAYDYDAMAETVLTLAAQRDRLAAIS